MASSLRPHPPEHHGPSHAADLARSDSLDRPVGRLPGPQQRWGTRRANPLAGVAPTGRFGGDVALGASCFLCVYLWVMIRRTIFQFFFTYLLGFGPAFAALQENGTEEGGLSDTNAFALPELQHSQKGNDYYQAGTL